MRSTTVTVTNPAGIHTRPAAMIVQTVAKYKSDFHVTLYGYRINGKSILGLLTLAAGPGSEILLEFDGPDEDEACAAVTALFEAGFHEHE